MTRIAFVFHWSLSVVTQMCVHLQEITFQLLKSLHSYNSGSGMLSRSEFENPKRRFMFNSRHGVTSHESSATPWLEIQKEMSVLHCLFMSCSFQTYDGPLDRNIL